MLYRLLLTFSFTGTVAALFVRRVAQKRGARSLAMSASYIDPVTSQTFPLEEPRWSGGERDGQPIPLMLSALPGITRDMIDKSTRSLWRYAAAFPMACAEPISLGEGCTPLVPRPFGGGTPLFKCEWYNPTCSFKDRGTTVRARRVAKAVATADARCTRAPHVDVHPRGRRSDWVSGCARAARAVCLRR